MEAPTWTQSGYMETLWVHQPFRTSSASEIQQLLKSQLAARPRQGKQASLASWESFLSYVTEKALDNRPQVAK